MSEIKPYNQANATKKEEVANMFNKIAKTYDFLNHFLSLGIDIIWRRKALKMLIKDKPKSILDVATGTGDFAFEAIKILNPSKIVGVDIADQMLAIAQEKINKRNKNAIFTVKVGDSENLEFEHNSFDAVTVSFGVRNFENLDKGLENIYQVLKNDGSVMILEFSKPIYFPIKQLYNFYFFNVLPIFGKIFSKDNRAYTYLPESVKAFPDREAFIAKLRHAGFKQTFFKPMGLGICCAYYGKK